MGRDTKLWDSLTLVQRGMIADVVALHDMTDNPSDGSPGPHDTVHDLLHAFLGVETDVNAEHELLDLARPQKPADLTNTRERLTIEHVTTDQDPDDETWVVSVYEVHLGGKLVGHIQHTPHDALFGFDPSTYGQQRHSVQLWSTVAP